MSRNIDVYVARERAGNITVSDELTLNQILALILDKFSDRLNVICSPRRIIDKPPTHSDVSILLLAPNNRFIKAFNLAQVDNFRTIKFNSTVLRRVTLVGELTERDVCDIAYNNTQQVHFFTSLHEWTKLASFEQLHCEALICHQNWLKSQDVQYRQRNQQVRRELRGELYNFLREAPSKEKGKPITTADCSSPCGTKAANNNRSDKELRSKSCSDVVDEAEEEIGDPLSEVRQKFASTKGLSAQINNHMPNVAGSALKRSNTVDRDASKNAKGAKKSISIIGTLTDSRRSLPLEGTTDTPIRKDIIYKPRDVASGITRDHDLALALHLQLNGPQKP